MSELVPRPPTGHRIDETVFVRWWAIIHQRFGRSMSDPMTQLYRAFLDEHLTTEHFEQAAKLIFEGETWWPSPRRFVEVLQGDLKAYAGAQWREVLRIATKGNGEGFKELPEHTRRAVFDLGGLRKIELMEDRDRAYYERHFTDGLLSILEPKRKELPALALPSADG